VKGNVETEAISPDDAAGCVQDNAVTDSGTFGIKGALYF
jgi:hypothetical protein